MNITENEYYKINCLWLLSCLLLGLSIVMILAMALYIAVGCIGVGVSIMIYNIHIVNHLGKRFKK